MKRDFLQRLARATEALRDDGLFKDEHPLISAQQAVIRLADGRELINLCANNYLGLANHPALREAAHRALDRHGYGMASVRFICGTHVVHKELELELSRFLGAEDTLLYSSCFDANGGLFETLLEADDAVISDALNHASIIDGIRLCKAQRWRYANNDLDELETRLQEAAACRTKLIVTDGVFSMDGAIARLRDICDLADRYGALVMVDDSHATGFVGPTGRGTHELHGVVDRIDILTGTLGKALGGAIGGYTAGRKEIIAWLRQRSRPYLFSNSLPPAIAATTLRVLDLLKADTELRPRLWNNAQQFRDGLTALGFELCGAGHPIIPVMLNDAGRAGEFARRLLAQGIYAVSFSYPVVPHGKARIRTQMSSAHTPAQVTRAIAAFESVGRDLGVLT